MIKLTKRSLLAFFISFVLMFISASISHAQEENPDEVAKKHGISFPIPELGNCNNFSACKSFCDNEANKNVCLNFAQKKGIKTDNRGPKDSKVIQSAQLELGCNSESSCRAVCEQESNRGKCASFAQKHGLGGSRGGNPGDRNVLNKAKEILGCDSEASCKSVCENPDNKDKCSNFAKSTGLGGGIRRVGPGGCNSEESCKSFCESNKEACQQFGGPPEGAEGGRRGPDGCNSEQSCRKICEANPEKCQGLGGQGSDQNQRGPQDMEAFCKANPDKCSGGKFSGPDEERMRPPAEFLKRPEGFRPPEGVDRKDPGENRPFVGSEGFAPRSDQPTPSSGPSDTGSSGLSGSEQEVRGISIQTNLLHQILEFFRF